MTMCCMCENTSAAAASGLHQIRLIIIMMTVGLVGG